jgi:hypothetical protein
MRSLRSLYGLAWRNLIARRLRTFLTGAAIALGVASVFATSLIGESAQVRTASLARQVSQADLQITPRDDETLDVRWLDAVRAHPDVAIASPEVIYSAALLEPSGASLILLGVDPQVYFPMERIDGDGRRQTRFAVDGLSEPVRWRNTASLGVVASTRGFSIDDRWHAKRRQDTAQRCASHRTGADFDASRRARPAPAAAHPAQVQRAAISAPKPHSSRCRATARPKRARLCPRGHGGNTDSTVMRWGWRDRP